MDKRKVVTPSEANENDINDSSKLVQTTQHITIDTTTSVSDNSLPATLDNNGIEQQSTIDVGIFKIRNLPPKEIPPQSYIDAIREATTRSITNINLFNTLPKKTEDAEQYLKSVKKLLSSIEDKNKIAESIFNTQHLLSGLETLSNSITFPYQITMGLILNRLKEIVTKDKLGNFTTIVSELISKITIRSCQNYMLAAKIVEMNGMEKYYPAGITVIYKLIRILEHMEIPDNTIDPIMYAFNKLGNPTTVDDNDYPRIAQYVVYLNNDLKDCGVNIEILFELFKKGYVLTKKDISTILKYSASVKDFCNNYLKALIENDLNREKAISSVTGAPPARKKAQQQVELLDSAETLLAKLKQLFEKQPTIALTPSEENLAHEVITQLGKKTNQSRKILLIEVNKNLQKLNAKKEPLPEDELELAKKLFSELDTLLKP